jgi:CubicO group peptidase (beta-lactamase class C family)
VYTGAEYIAAVAKAPLLHQPGTVWDYGASTDVLGLMVEAITGQSLGAFLRERLWEPLGMVDTSFTVPASQLARYALPFGKDPETGAAQTILHATGKPLKFECGNGCAASTAMDYLRFGQMLLNGGAHSGQRVIAPRTVAMMTSNQLMPEVRGRTTDPTLPEGYGFGLGFAVRNDIAPRAGAIGEYNWGGAFGTNFWVDPKEQMVVVMMVAAPGAAIRAQNGGLLRSLVYQAIME